MNEWNPYQNEPEQQPEQKPAEQPERQPAPPVNAGMPYRPPVKQSNGWKVAAIAIGIVCVFMLAAILGLFTLFRMGGGSLFSDGQPEAPLAGTPGNGPTLQITELDEDAQGLSTTDIVDKNLNSTVLLTTYRNSSTGGFPFGQTSDQEVQSGSASGIVWTKDGYIITNWHCVVDESTGKEFPRVDVTMYDGTVYEHAEIIGYDSSTDLAVIKVNATDLTPAEFGDSDNLKMGNKVVALGNSGGLGWSTTQGIVSGLARDVYEDTGYAIKCLQIDAAINPGNSGGPLLNAVGQVIAVNSAKIVADGYEGIGFAIPINEAKIILEDLVNNGYVTGRVALGVTGQTYSDSHYSGFLIYTVEDGSPLKDTDVKRGDLIIAVDKATVESYADLRSELAKHTVGDTVTLTLLRSNGRNVTEFTVTVKLAESKGK